MLNGASDLDGSEDLGVWLKITTSNGPL